MSNVARELDGSLGRLGVDASRSSRWAGSIPRAIPEASGIVKSRRYPGIYWVHNDSGNPPLLFAVRGDGRIVRQFRLAVPNIDWEDIAIDDQGHLYLGDIGNNTARCRSGRSTGSMSPTPPCPKSGRWPLSSATFYALPRANRFDAEGLIVRPRDRDPRGQVPRWPRGRAVLRAARCRRRPCSGPPGLVRSAGCRASRSPRRAPP